MNIIILYVTNRLIIRHIKLTLIKSINTSKFSNFVFAIFIYHHNTSRNLLYS